MLQQTGADEVVALFQLAQLARALGPLRLEVDEALEDLAVQLGNGVVVDVQHVHADQTEGARLVEQQQPLDVQTQAVQGQLARLGG
ncbi:hypothetical protein D3C81_2041410 [compost metagenome]